MGKERNMEKEVEGERVVTRVGARMAMRMRTQPGAWRCRISHLFLKKSTCDR